MRLTRALILLSQVFAVICFSYFPVVFCFYPETSRRTLEDMDHMFMRNPSWLVCGKQELTQRSRPQHLVEAEKERIAQAEASPAVYEPKKTVAVKVSEV